MQIVINIFKLFLKLFKRAVLTIFPSYLIARFSKANTAVSHKNLNYVCIFEFSP